MKLPVHQRRELAEALGREGGPGAVPRLLELLADEDEGAARAAAEALRALGAGDLARAVLAVRRGDPSPAMLARDPGLLPPLRSLLHARDPRCRAAAVDALGALGDAEAREALRRALRDPAPVVRRAAIRSVAAGGEEGAAALLLDGLEAAEAGIRLEAAGAIGRLGAVECVDPLGRRLRDPDAGVRRAAAVALGRLAEQSGAVLPVLLGGGDDPSEEVREGVVWALGSVRGPDACAALIQALEDPSDRVVITAARALGRRADPGALPALTARWKRWWEPGPVRRACGDAIQEIRQATGACGSELTPVAPPAQPSAEVVPARPPEDPGPPAG